MIGLFNFITKKFRILSSCFLCFSFLFLRGMESEQAPIVDAVTCSKPHVLVNLPTNSNNYEATSSTMSVVVSRTPEMDSQGYAIIRSWYDFRAELDRLFLVIEEILQQDPLLTSRDELFQEVNSLHSALARIQWATLNEEQQTYAWEALNGHYAYFVKKIKQFIAQRSQGERQRLVYAAFQSKLFRINFAFQEMSKLIYKNSHDKQEQAKKFYQELFSLILSYILVF